MLISHTRLVTWRPQHDTDLSFFAGDIIQVLESSTANEDWWEGNVQNSQRVGLFPSNYVERTVHSLPPPPPKVSKTSKPAIKNASESPPVTYVPYRSTHAAMAHPHSGGPNAVGLQQQAPTRAEEGKKARLDQLKNTVCLPKHPYLYELTVPLPRWPIVQRVE